MHSLIVVMSNVHTFVLIEDARIAGEARQSRDSRKRSDDAFDSGVLFRKNRLQNSAAEANVGDGKSDTP